MAKRDQDIYEAYRLALAANIRKHRRLQKISASDMAAMLGMSVGNYYKMEQPGNAQVVPSADRLPLLASLFGISLDELCGLAPPTTSLSSDEGLLLQYFRQANQTVQPSIIQIVRAIFVNRMHPNRASKLAEFLVLNN